MLTLTHSPYLQKEAILSLASATFDINVADILSKDYKSLIFIFEILQTKYVSITLYTSQLINNLSKSNNAVYFFDYFISQIITNTL